jgi:hypothetical protein
MRKTGAKRLTLQNYFFSQGARSHLALNSTDQICAKRYSKRHQPHRISRIANAPVSAQIHRHTDELPVTYAFRGLQWSAIMRKTRAKRLT